MLINIDPLLSPDLLHALRAMGHRHDLAIVDANYPCDPARTRTVRLDGASATDVLAAVMSVLPLEIDEPASAWRMIADDQPDKHLPVFADFERLVDGAAPGRGIAAVTPDEFKARAEAAYVTVITGERRLYANVIVRKGVIPAAPGDAT